MPFQAAQRVEMEGNLPVIIADLPFFEKAAVSGQLSFLIKTPQIQLRKGMVVETAIGTLAVHGAVAIVFVGCPDARHLYMP